MKLSTSAFALASGILLGLGLLVVTWFIIALDGATGEVTVLSRVLRGYNISPLGSVIGLVWGFGLGLIGGAVFAALYNCMLSCCGCGEGEVSKAIEAEMARGQARRGEQGPGPQG